MRRGDMAELDYHKGETTSQGFWRGENIEPVHYTKSQIVTAVLVLLALLSGFGYALLWLVLQTLRAFG